MARQRIKPEPWILRKERNFKKGNLHLSKELVSRTPWGAALSINNTGWRVEGFREAEKDLALGDDKLDVTSWTWHSNECCSTEWQELCVELYQKKCDQQIQGGGSPSLFHSAQTPAVVLCLGPQKSMDLLEQVQSRPDSPRAAVLVQWGHAEEWLHNKSYVDIL